MIRNLNAEILAMEYGFFIKAKESYDRDTSVDRANSRQNLLDTIESCKKSISRKKFPNLYGDLEEAESEANRF